MARIRWVGVAVLGALAGCAPVGAAVPVAAVAPVQPGSLVGATPAVLAAAFGPPALRRVDGEAQVWLYHSPVCGLDLILYPDAAGTPRVAMAAPVAADAVLAPAACMASLERQAAS